MSTWEKGGVLKQGNEGRKELFVTWKAMFVKLLVNQKMSIFSPVEDKSLLLSFKSSFDYYLKQCCEAGAAHKNGGFATLI